ncbi:MAG TPA: ABC transporter permease [Candidatus Limnocylindrales bacterium]|nr:ABC transporter permease [Candidatus Limnocylindrales bacterium]
MAVPREAPPLRSTALRPNAPGLVLEALRESWSRRRLIRYLVQADLKKKGSDTLLGNLWWILDPLLQMLVYVVLVTIIFARSQPDYPLFIFAAILPWKWFTSSISDAIASVTSQERLIKQIQFPKIVLPFASTVAGLVNFGFGLVGLAGLLVLLYPHRINITLVLIPVVALVQFAFTLALTFLAAATNVFYRDLGNVSRHLLRLWFYLSPALYSISQIDHLAAESPILGTLFRLNPFTILFEAYRDVIYAGTRPDWAGLASLFAVSLVLIAIAAWVFKRVEPSFAKVL